MKPKCVRNSYENYFMRFRTSHYILFSSSLCDQPKNERAVACSAFTFNAVVFLQGEQVGSSFDVRE